MAFINTGRHVASSSGFRLIGGDDVQEYSEGGVNYRAHTWLNTGSVTATADGVVDVLIVCLLYTSPSPRDLSTSRMPSSA